MSGGFSDRVVLRRDAPRLVRGAFPFPDSTPVHPIGVDDPLNRPCP
jgi:hypothetical protein